MGVVRSILVVDDNPDAAESMALLLGMYGHETRVAFDGLQAMEVAAIFRPDLILLDLEMPKLDGYETARQIRALPWGKDMVLIAITGWTNAEDHPQAQEARFNNYLIKPVDFAVLNKLLAELPS